MRAIFFTQYKLYEIIKAILKDIVLHLSDLLVSFMRRKGKDYIRHSRKG